MQKAKDPNWGLHKADSDRALTPPSAEDRNHRRGGEPRSAWRPGTPTGRGQRASQQRGKRGKAVGSSGVPRAGAPSRREGAECRGATQRHGEAGSHLRRRLCDSDLGSGTVRVSYNLNKEGNMSGAKLNNTCGFDVTNKAIKFKKSLMPGYQNLATRLVPVPWGLQAPRPAPWPLPGKTGSSPAPSPARGGTDEAWRPKARTSGLAVSRGQS